MKVLVLNADMTVLGAASPRRALTLVVKQRAEVIAETNIRVHPTMFLPSVIRLIKAVRNLWKKRVPWSKANVHTRDKYTCQYCSTKLDKRDATIDHVIPRIQGGKNSWENTVCACYDCNNKKNSRTPEQARMTLRKRPYQPTIMEFIQHKIVVDGLADLLKSIS